MTFFRKQKVLAWLLSMCVLIGMPASADSEAPELYARSAVLMDGDSGRILYGKNEDQEMPMASTTKIMTCIVALEQADPELICTVSANAASQPKVKLGMQTGEKFYLRDLLYSLMLESHNDTAVCIAENVAGSVEQFADLMNQKALQLGCSHTYYITPNGLDAEDENGIHHTTAAELAEVMRYCLNNSLESDAFLEITRTSSYQFSNLNGTRNYSCTNHNALLQILEGAVSGKTGFTGNAGYCYVGAVRQDGKFLIVALLACGWPSNKGYKWVDTKKLVQYGVENFEKRVVIDRKMTTDSVVVEDGAKDSVATKILWDTEIRTEEEEQARQTTVLLQKNEQVNCRIQMLTKLRAPIAAGTQIGTVTFLIEDAQYASFPIVTEEKIKEQNYGFILRELGSVFVNFVTKKLAIFG